MIHTYDLAHERDLSQFVRQHFAHLAERVSRALFAGEPPLVSRSEPLSAVLAVETVVREAVAMGNHPNLVIAVCSKVCGVPVLRADVTEPMLTGSAIELLADRSKSTPQTRARAAAQRMAKEAVQGQAATDAPPQKIRIVRAGDVASRVLDVLDGQAVLGGATTALDIEERMELHGVLSVEIAKMIGEGLQ